MYFIVSYRLFYCEAHCDDWENQLAVLHAEHMNNNITVCKPLVDLQMELGH